MANNSTARKLTGGIIAIILLFVCLCITTFAIIYASLSVDNNFFHTGTIEINLNDGNPVITENEFLFEPGMTVEKDFFIKNESNNEVYYKIYFDDIKGGLANVLDVTISEKQTGGAAGKVLYTGKIDKLTKELVIAADDTLAAGQKRDLQIEFYFPPSSGNSAKGQNLEFTICADATQTKNNPNKLFS